MPVLLQILNRKVKFKIKYTVKHHLCEPIVLRILWFINDAFSNLHCIVSNEMMINSLVKIWKEATMAAFKKLSPHLTGGTRKATKILS